MGGRTAVAEAPDAQRDAGLEPRAPLASRSRSCSGRLSVFAGGWTLEAAEAVGLGDGIEQGESLDLSRCWWTSRWSSRASGGRGGTVQDAGAGRQYARERLEESGEAELRSGAGTPSTSWPWPKKPSRSCGGRRTTAWLERLEAEHDNMRAALSWTLERREAELALRLAGALWRFWRAGILRRGEKVARGGAGEGRTSRRRGHKALAGLGHWRGRATLAERRQAAAEEGLKLSEEAGIEGVIAGRLPEHIGGGGEEKGDHERAKELLEEALVLSREAGDRRGIAWSLGSLANVSSSQGDHERAKELYEEGLALSREIGRRGYRSAISCSALGYEFLLEGDHERATALNEEAAALHRSRGYRSGLEYRSRQPWVGGARAGGPRASGRTCSRRASCCARSWATR